MKEVHTATKRGYVEDMGTVRDTPLLLRAFKKRKSPRKNPKKAERISQKRIDGVKLCSEEHRVPFSTMMRKNPSDVNPVRIRFPVMASVSSRPFLQNEAAAAKQNAEITARSSPS